MLTKHKATIYVTCDVEKNCDCKDYKITYIQIKDINI